MGNDRVGNARGGERPIGEADCQLCVSIRTHISLLKDIFEGYLSSQVLGSRGFGPASVSTII